MDEFYRILLLDRDKNAETFINNALFHKEKYYKKNRYEIQKKNGLRVIYRGDSKEKLYHLQKNLTKNFLDKIYISDAAYGFVKGVGYWDFLEEHTNYCCRNHFLRMDISDFFGSITENMVRDSIGYYVDENLEDYQRNAILDVICDIVTYNNYLPQGAPCSPVVSNIVFRPVDIRIEKYCEKLGVHYSRYADDFLFSEDIGQRSKLNRNFVRTIERILHENGYRVNYDKLRTANTSLSLNGFVVDSEVHLSRKKRKKMKAVLYYLEHNEYKKEAEWLKDFNANMKKYDISIESKEGLIDYLAGNRAFLIHAMNYVEEESSYYGQYQKDINRIETMILNIEKINEE